MTKILALTLLLAAVPTNHANLQRPASDADLLRAFAFARCLEKGYDKTAFGEDAQRVANAYFELGKINNPGVYEEISRRAESIDAAKPTIMGGHNFAIMACLEFYESASLKQFAQKGAARPANGRK